MLVGPVQDCFSQSIDVVIGNSLRICQFPRDLYGDGNLDSCGVSFDCVTRMKKPATNLIDVQIRIGTDDGTTREVHSLSRQVSTETTLLSLQTLTESSDRFRILWAGEDLQVSTSIFPTDKPARTHWHSRTRRS